MELRSCTHLHFIQAVKDGSVTKILNVFRGRPALKFKKVNDIYEAGVALVSLQTCKVELEDLPIDCGRAKAENPCILAGQRTIIKGDGETLEPNCSTCNYGVKTELDDLNFGTVTLKQIKERCQAKKRNRSSSVALSKETIENCSPGKQDHSILQSAEEEYDVMEPLSRWKSRILKDRKTKKKSIKSRVSSSSENVLSIEKSENIPDGQAIFQSRENLPAPVDIKIEFPEPSYLDGQSTTVISMDASCACINPLASSKAVSSVELLAANDGVLENAMSMFSIKEPETVEDCLLETGMPRISSEEPETASDLGFEARTSTFFSGESQCCVVNAESHERIEHIGSIGPEVAHDCVLEDRLSLVSIEGPETQGCLLETAMQRISSEDSATASYCCSEAQTPTFFSRESQFCVVNEECYEHTKHIDPESIVGVGVPGRDLKTGDIEKIVSHQFSDTSLSELKRQGSVIDPHPNDGLSETVSPSADNRSNVYNGQSFPGIHEELENAHSCSQDQLPDAAIGKSLQRMEIRDGHGLCFSEDRVEDNALHPVASVISSPVSDRSSICDSNLCSSPNGCLLSVADGSPTTAEKPSACTDVARNCLTEIHYQIDEAAQLAVAEDCHHSEMPHPPERLLTTRKTISPTSQKRLCKAMEFTELDDEQYYRYTRKLCYSKQTENKIGRLERANQIQRVEVTLSPKKIIGKPKNDKNGFHNRGILKAPRPCRAVQHFSTGCTSAQSFSESAISFSRQQMHDIESIATKLTKELKSMKDIVEGTFHSELYPATSSIYSADEVRIATQNATRVEESARRWLSIMSRDCNRFCKIMKLTEKGCAASGNVVHKEKRKIVFADEAGRQLCDVKTYENDMASVVESHSEKPEIVD